MSLINDAIKKANQANKEKSSQSGSPAREPATDGMHAASRPAAPPSSGMTGMFIIAGVVVFVLLGGFLLVLGLKNRTPAYEPSTEDVQAVVVPDNPQQPRAPLATTTPAFAEPTIDPVVVHTSIEDVVNEANPLLAEPIPEPVETPDPVPPKLTGPPAFPALKLQGIFYRLNDPSVIINGKTLWTNDSIDGVKVVKIERTDVTLEFDGRTKVLQLK